MDPTLLELLYEGHLLQASTTKPSGLCGRRALPAAPSSRGALVVLLGREQGSAAAEGLVPTCGHTALPEIY